MRALVSSLAVLLITAGTVTAQSGPTEPPPKPAPDVTALISRLSLERYKATVKGLTAFGDRRQGTERNRKAVDWIEAQLKSYGCPTERINTSYDPPPPPERTGGAAAAAQAASVAAGDVPRIAGGGRPRGNRAPTGVNTDPDAAARREAARAQLRSRRRTARASKCSAPRSAASSRTRCTSSAHTWTVTAGARPPTTTGRARPW